jgi:hypothetical protein
MKLLVAIFMGMHAVSYAQPPSTSNSLDSLANDSTLIMLNEFTKEYAVLMSTWSPERKERFNALFVQQRGNLKLVDPTVLKPEDTGE